jgi:hypothetical protein
MRTALSFSSICLAVSLALTGCGQAGDPDLLTEEGAEALEDVEGKADQYSITFTAFTDPNGIGTRGETETKVVIKSASAYKSYFGHAAPREVDFSKDYVFFYSAGVKPTGGYTASVDRVWRSRTGYTVYFGTRLESPGDDCIVTQALTKPYVLVKFKKQPQAGAFRTSHKDDIKSCAKSCYSSDDCDAGQYCTTEDGECLSNCPPGRVCPAVCSGRCVERTNPCAATLCPTGTVCVVKQVQCVRAPCPPVASCEPIPTGPFCGGIAGIRCPGAGECVDDPTDSCDPNNGGADCGGRCVCNALGSCVQGYVWDSSPDVCGCVPDPASDPCAAVRCAAGTTCKNVNGQAKCLATCGSVVCGEGQVCCNASCGMCTAPGQFCIQIACN